MFLLDLSPSMTRKIGTDPSGVDALCSFLGGLGEWFENNLKLSETVCKSGNVPKQSGSINRRSVWIAPPKMDSRRTVGRTVVGTRSDGRRPFYSSIRALYTPFKARSGRSGFGNPAVGFRSESKSEMKC